jgi:hypothetical protein
MGLACLISNSNPQDQAQLVERLTKEEVVIVQQVIQSGACLPEDFEALLEKGRSKLLINASAMPTRECF